MDRVVLNSATEPCRLQVTPSQPLIAPQDLVSKGLFNRNRVSCEEVENLSIERVVC